MTLWKHLVIAHTSHYHFGCAKPFWGGFLLLCCLVGLQAEILYGDTWIGAGQISQFQERDWNVPGNWLNNAVPIGEIDTFQLRGDGSIAILGDQSAGGLIFENFTSTRIYPDPNDVDSLALVNDPDNNPPEILVGETPRDTYGVDYYTVGPSLEVNLQLDSSPTTFRLGYPGSGAERSAMLISGILTAAEGATINYQGNGTGTSLWITGENSLPGVTVNVNAGSGSGSEGYILYLADDGRLDQAAINLNAAECYLGLHDTQSTLPPLLNQIHSSAANIFADRSYQTSDTNSAINVQQSISGIVEVFNHYTQFGSTGPFGRTNNGYSLRLEELRCTATSSIDVNNGNLTEDRAGGRYVSGANRLQEAHNYTYVDNLTTQAQPFTKGGTGVLAIEKVNGGGNWPLEPTVDAGVLRLGTSAIPHTIPAASSLVLATADAGVGIAWDTQIYLAGPGPEVPFPIKPAGINAGQCGAVDVDLWNFGWTVGALPTIDTNIPVEEDQWTYLRIGSSMGGDASFERHPQPAKHASIAYKNSGGSPTQVVPFINPSGPPIYYFGGGGGTLQIDTQLDDYEGPTDLEMGTSGNLLPGRVALNPGGDAEMPNLYKGSTYIRAGTLQLMSKDAVLGTDAVRLGTYDQEMTQGLYKNPAPPAKWEGPGQLLVDPDPTEDWNLEWYTAQGGKLLDAMRLDGGVIGWTDNVQIPGVPGQYGALLWSDLKGAPQQVNVLGLGGEYSIGTMKTTFNINNSPEKNPVLLYKAGKNSVLDLTQTPVQTVDPNDPLALNAYTGGTIIAGGTVLIDDGRQLNAAQGGTGGPIAILNGGRLQIAASADLYVPIKINTAGTPDTLKNCGSVIDVDQHMKVRLLQPFDFSSNPGGYLEKEGYGELFYEPIVAPILSDANAWGLKLTGHSFTHINQLPVNPGSANTGPLIGGFGRLRVEPVPVGVGIPDTDPGYGFRCLVSLKGTVGQHEIAENALFRTNGYAPNEIRGGIDFLGEGEGSVVHLSRNASPATVSSLADLSRGNGGLSFFDITVYMTGGGPTGDYNVLPKNAGFGLVLYDNVVFHASRQNDVYGRVYFWDIDLERPVRINGAEADPIPISSSPYTYHLTPQTWSLRGTAYTGWNGITEKIGEGTVQFNRQQGAKVTVSLNTLLRILDGTIIARGTADPFTDTTTNFSLDIENNSTAIGLEIAEGSKKVDLLYGTGNTWVWGTGTTLTATSIVQGYLTVGAGAKVTIAPSTSGSLAGATPLPEPSAFLLLGLGASGLLAYAWRRRK